jgi:hypothetical protein
MADLSGITAVRPTASTQYRLLEYGATIAAGNTVALSSNVAVLADADASSSLATTAGIAMTPGIDDGFGLVATAGSIILVGTTLTVGTTYVQSDTAGGIMPIADLATGDYVTILGVATSASQLLLDIAVSGVQVPA